MNEELESWLSEREPSPPRALSERILAALEASAAAPASVADDWIPPLARRLGDAATALLARVRQTPRTGHRRSGTGTLPDDAVLREQALDLLTADALLTYACEAAAGAGAASLVAFGTMYGPARIAELMAPEAP